MVDSTTPPSLRPAAPIEILEIVDRRYPPAAEMAAYLVVSEALVDAGGRSATYVAVRIARQGDQLVVAVHDDGRRRQPDRLRHVRDRVGALGGHVEGDGNRLRAEMPCV